MHFVLLLFFFFSWVLLFQAKPDDLPCGSLCFSAELVSSCGGFSSPAVAGGALHTFFSLVQKRLAGLFGAMKRFHEFHDTLEGSCSEPPLSTVTHANTLTLLVPNSVHIWSKIHLPPLLQLQSCDTSGNVSTINWGKALIAFYFKVNLLWH